MPDTAVLEMGTAADLEAPPEETSPETATELAPETDALETLETEGEEEGRTYTAAELKEAAEEATKRANGNWEKWRADTEAKAKADADDAAYQNGLQFSSQQAATRRLQQAHQALALATKEAIDAGKDGVEPQRLAALVQAINNDAAAVARYQMHDQYARDRIGALQQLAPNYRPSPELLNAARQAQAAFDYKALARIDMQMAIEAARQTVGSETQTRIEAEAAAKAAAARPAPKTPAKGASPTTVAGTGAGGARNTRQILDTANPKSPEYAAAYEKEYGFKPLR